MQLRDAELSDAEAIAGIYNDAVVTTSAIWTDVTVDADNRMAWLERHWSQGYPVIVAVDEGGAVAGYATFGDWRPFDGYRHTVENAIYVRADRRGEGVGRELLTELIERARGLGKHVMVAAIEAGNVGSIRLHESVGFVSSGTVAQVGVKFGTWLDLAFLSLLLDDRSATEADAERA